MEFTGRIIGIKVDGKPEITLTINETEDAKAAYDEFNQENIAAPWGPLPFFPDRPRRCLAVADMQTRTGVLYVNGMVAGYGEIEERDEANAGGLCWGDLSPGVGGAYILEGVKLATFD